MDQSPSSVGADVSKSGAESMLLLVASISLSLESWSDAYRAVMLCGEILAVESHLRSSCRCTCRPARPCDEEKACAAGGALRMATADARRTNNDPFVIMGRDLASAGMRVSYLQRLIKHAGGGEAVAPSSSCVCRIGGTCGNWRVYFQFLFFRHRVIFAVAVFCVVATRQRMLVGCFYRQFANSDDVRHNTSR